jgi:hypothetical protein
VRLSLRISKIGQVWRWYFEDMDAAGFMEESPDFSTWRDAEAAARAAHPEVEDRRVFRHLVRDRSSAYEDSL